MGPATETNDLGLFCKFWQGESGFKIKLLTPHTDFYIIGLKIVNFAVWQPLILKRASLTSEMNIGLSEQMRHLVI